MFLHEKTLLRNLIHVSHLKVNRKTIIISRSNFLMLNSLYSVLEAKLELLAVQVWGD